jgi:hypothetical protein
MPAFFSDSMRWGLVIDRIRLRAAENASSGAAINEVFLKHITGFPTPGR